MSTIQIALPLVTSFYYLVVYSPNGSKIYFFNGDLREEIHIAQPPSFVKDGTYKRICGLKKYLYGMKQARAWYEKIDKFSLWWSQSLPF